MSKKKTHEEYMEQIKDRLSEYEVLSKYEQATKKMTFRHKKCGTVFEKKPMHFFYGQGCPVCNKKEAGRKIRKSFENFLEEIPDKYRGWEFKNFTKIGAPVIAICPVCGHEHEYASAKPFVAGNAGCRVCAGRAKMPDELLEQELKKYGWGLIERLPARIIDGSGYHTPQLDVYCLKCGDRKTTSLSNIRKYECNKCSGHFDGTSGEEDAIFSWLKSLCPDAVQSDRTVLKKMGKRGYELDMLVPSKKVAIEYNGRFWHSVNSIMKRTGMTYAEAKKYHRNKSLECERNGIRLIHIWDYEWEDERKQKVLKNIILGALGMLTERYYARDCKVCRYDNESPRWEELNRFFAENNIQGNRGGTIVYTLEKDGRILMAYKFGRPSGGKAKLKYQYEMVRGASAPGVQVIGGATRLWKHFMDEVKPDSIVYYIDYNYFDGRSVEKIGLKYTGGEPGVRNYFIETGEVKNRQPAKHAEIKKLIAEDKVLEMWNAGTKVYEYRA